MPTTKAHNVPPHDPPSADTGAHHEAAGAFVLRNEIEALEKAGRALAKSVDLSDDAAWLLGAIESCDGYEVNDEDWKDEAEELRDAGLITLSGARGPDRVWRRAELCATA